MRWICASFGACLALAAATGLGADQVGGILLSMDFEDAESLKAVKAKIAGEVTFEKGRFGNAARIGKGCIRLKLPEALPEKGTIEYWARTEWPVKKAKTGVTYFSMAKKVAEDRTATLAAWSAGENYGYDREMSVVLDEQARHTRERFFSRRLACYMGGPDDGDWHKVTIAYDLSLPGEGRAELYIDEMLRDRLTGLKLVPKELGLGLTIGAQANRHAFAIDSFRIERTARQYPQKPGRNLLDNPGFEIDANNDGIPDCWGQIAGKPGVGYWGGPPALKKEQRGRNTWTREKTFSGKHAAQMESFDAQVGGQIISGSVRGIEPGGQYELDGTVCAFNPKTCRTSVRLVPWDSRHKVMLDHIRSVSLMIPGTSKGQWVSIAEVANGKNLYTVPEDCRSLTVYLHVTGKGNVLWDDLYLGQPRGE